MRRLTGYRAAHDVIRNCERDATVVCRRRGETPLFFTTFFSFIILSFQRRYVIAVLCKKDKVTERDGHERDLERCGSARSSCCCCSREHSYRMYHEGTDSVMSVFNVKLLYYSRGTVGYT